MVNAYGDYATQLCFAACGTHKPLHLKPFRELNNATEQTA